MKRRATAVIVVAFVGLVWSPRGALASCLNGNLANADDPGCVRAQACQKAVLDAVRVYVNKIQTSMNNIVISNTKGANVSLPPYACQGGAANGAACLANNGLCKAGTNKGAPCGDDSDCSGVDSCDRTKGCNKKGVCVGGTNPGQVCTKQANCTGGGVCSYPNDAVECQPDPKKIAGAKDYTAQHAALRKTILGKCQALNKEVDIEDIGLDTSTACPGILIALAQGEPAAYEALITCLLSVTDGDVTGGKVVDTILRPIGKGMGNTKPQAKKSGSKQAADPLPRIMVEIPGSTFLQVGVKQTDTGIGQGGGAIPLAFASCTGGNNAPVCLNNVDCNGGVCQRAVCKTCVGGVRAGLACVSNANCLGGTCTGTCSPDASQFKTFGTATRGINSDDGNILTVLASCASPALPVCLYTRTKNAGNGTSSMGWIDFASGAYDGRGPVETIVQVGNVCPICGAGANSGCGIGQVKQGSCTGLPGADAGPNNGQTCNNIGATDPACPPTVTGSEPKIPSPFELGTGIKTLSDAGGVGPGTTGAGSKKICGFCDISGTIGCQHGPTGDPLCAIGCQTVADCPTGPPGPATVCDFNITAAGFHGDPTIGTVSVAGNPSIYAPLYASVICSGITNSVLDTTVGLPSPAKSINPFVNLYTFSKDF